MMRKKLPAERVMEAQNPMGKSQKWRATGVALAAVVACVAGFDAHALALGRMTVQSALGEPLRAEIEVPDINTEEAGSLKTSVASPQAFSAAGLDYNAALSNLQITLQRRADGRAYLRLASDRAITEPFVDLILEVNWSTGRIVRDYTMLFDPPNLRQQASGPSPTQLPAAPQAVAPRTATPSAPVARAPAPPARDRRAAPSAPAPAPSATPTAQAPLRGDGGQVPVKAGDTAGKIAAANKPASVSLDQMLVAMLRANPDAFIAGNVNRLKSGVVLDMPSAEQAASVPSTDASRTLVAQAKDFNEFRRKLAEGAPSTQMASAQRQSGGRVQTQVEESKPAAAAPDKLTLSKGSAQGQSGKEDQIAKDRQAKDAATRVAELSKNISDLGKIGSPAGPAAAGAAPVAAASKPGLAVAAGSPASRPAAAASASAAAVVTASASAAVAPKPATATSAPAPVASAAAPAPLAAASAQPVVAAASKPASAVAAASAPIAAVAASAAASSPSATPVAAAASGTPAPATAATPTTAPVAAASAVAAKPAVKPAAPPPPVETSLLDDLMANPLVLPAAGALVALLAGFGFYRARQRKKATQVDSSFLESRLQPDSFFGASGGQRIDTNEGSATGSSMVYSPSQLDAAGDVDPVAEADVYLAYGRDLQAEEILKEAMRTNSTRVAIHVKLLEIYAKRRDNKAFEVVATEAFGLTKGEGPEWERVCELGREVDAGNALYQPGGRPSGIEQASLATTSMNAASFASSTIPQMIQPELSEPAAAVDLDLDLDFSLGDDEPGAPSAVPGLTEQTAPLHIEPTVAMQAQPDGPPALDMDFSSATVAIKSPPSNPVPPEPVKLSVPDLALSASGLSFSPEPASGSAGMSAAAPADAGMIEFDLGALSLDLDAPPSSQSPDSIGDADPLETKLSLAEEFRAIGDEDGARALVREVVEQASGGVKSKAQRMLAEMG